MFKMYMGVVLIRYWFEFEHKHYSDLPSGLGWGCGITAYSYDDAIALLKQYVFIDKPIAPFKRMLEDIDVYTLEPNHVLSNLGAPIAERGIWYPGGYTNYFTLPRR